MKKIITTLLLTCTLLVSCKPDAEKYFAVGALNCNMLFGFAGAGLQRELASPAEKLVDEKTYATAPMKRTEIIANKIKTIEENYAQVKALPKDEDAQQMIDASLALYAFTLPVYKKEYTDLAALYDNNAPAEKIAEAEKKISDAYSAKFEQLYNAVVSNGTAYAQRHNIPVQTVNTSPQ